jgi:nicotinamide riboside transporter PnuC
LYASVVADAIQNGGFMSTLTTSFIEWSATVLSLVGFWLCIQHRPSCFLVFLVADVGWFISAWAHDYASLLFQQTIYILLNIVGYRMWQREERLRKELERLESRELRLHPPTPRTTPIEAKRNH